MLCGREGNCRSGVALAMDFNGQSTYRAHGQGKEDEHPTYAHSVRFTLLIVVCARNEWMNFSVWIVYDAATDSCLVHWQ